MVHGFNTFPEKSLLLNFWQTLTFSSRGIKPTLLVHEKLVMDIADEKNYINFCGYQPTNDTNSQLWFGK